MPNRGLSLSLLFEGRYRSAFVYGRLADLLEWSLRMDRPRQAILLSVIRQLLELSPADLQRQQNAWRLEKGTEPKIYVVARDQARLYCCLKGADIVILAWDIKKQPRANPMVLKRAQQRAVEVL